MNKAVLIQARLSSARFPQKMLENIGSVTLLEYVYKRCQTSAKTDEVVVVTSNKKSDDELYALCLDKDIPVFRGDLDNVLKRYIDAADEYNVDLICRVCGDSPFVDIEAIDEMFHYFEKNSNLDYTATTNSLNGFMSEIVTLDILKKIYNEPLNKEDKEHVTKYIRDNHSKFNTKEFNLNLKPLGLKKFTLTIDYPEDIVIARNIADNLNGFDFSSGDIIKILNKMKTV